MKVAAFFNLILKLLSLRGQNKKYFRNPSKGMNKAKKIFRKSTQSHKQQLQQVPPSDKLLGLYG